MRNLFLFLLVLFSFTACFEDDIMVEPHQAGNLTLGQVELTENYKNQVFFDLETNTSVKQNFISDWDLGFETSDSGWHVILNTSKMMLAGNTESANFESIKSIGNIQMNFDPSHGNMDSTAVGEWYTVTNGNPGSQEMVYIIDRGTNEDYDLLGEKKVVFSFENKNTYKLRYSNLNGSEEKTALIEKDTSVNFVCFSFDTGIIDIEPNKNSWDLQFGKYSTLLFTDAGDPYPYLVTGVLLNPYKTQGLQDTLNLFDELSFEIAEQQIYTRQKDIIGYEWKEYDFDNTRYTVLPDKLYLVKTSDGFLYKLRFIDYYNSTGERGYPNFEFLRL